jgi:hypothetical protein
VGLQRWEQITTKGALPEGRYDHQAVLHAGMMYIISGLSVQDGFADGIWRLRIEDMTWEVRRGEPGFFYFFLFCSGKDPKRAAFSCSLLLLSAPLPRRLTYVRAPISSHTDCCDMGQ